MRWVNTVDDYHHPAGSAKRDAGSQHYREECGSDSDDSAYGQYWKLRRYRFGCYIPFYSAARAAKAFSSEAESSTLRVFWLRSIWRMRPERTLPGPTSMKWVAPLAMRS